MIKSLILLWLAFASTVTGRGQGTFQNLDFEAARIILVDLTPYDVAASNALPGWTAFSGSTQLATIPYNAFTFFPTVGLYGSNNNYVLSGNFGLHLSSSGSITQTGQVPLDSLSLLFKASMSPDSPFGVALGGQSLSYVPISVGPNFTYGADVSAYAGQSLALKFSGGFGALDDIQFSPNPIPEPTFAAIVVAGAVLFLARRLRSRPDRVVRQCKRVPIPLPRGH